MLIPDFDVTDWPFVGFVFISASDMQRHKTYSVRDPGMNIQIITDQVMVEFEVSYLSVSSGIRWLKCDGCIRDGGVGPKRYNNQLRSNSTTRCLDA